VIDEVEIFLDQKLKIQVKIDQAWRIRPAKPGYNRPIRIQMTNMRDRNDVIKQKKNLRGSNIYMDQDLTASELKNSKALQKYRGEVSQQGKQAFFKRGQLQVEGKLYGAVNGIITEVQGY